MISILTPARGRFHFLERTLNSVISNANSKDNYEILIGMDNDDVDTISKVEGFFTGKDVNYKIIIFERLFYKNFHLYIDGLYKESMGDFIWTLPDDCEVNTKDWDVIIDGYNSMEQLYLKVRLSCQYDTWPFSIIPIISKKWIEITGRIGECSQTDAWFGLIASELNIVTTIDVHCNLFNVSDGSQHSNIYEYKNEMEKDKEELKKYIQQTLKKN